jgi:plastocyanin
MLVGTIAVLVLKMRRLFVLLALCCAEAAVLTIPRTGLAVSASATPASQAPSSGGVGSIRGHVDVRRSLPVVEPRPSVSAVGMPLPHDQPDRRRSIVYLESAPAGAFEDRPAGRAWMTQRNETFVPHVLAVRAGTTVDFPNEDQTYHNVFSLSKTQRFDLGRYAAGQSKPVRFDRPGIVRVFCDIHSHMSAFILVFSHRFFDMTDPDGRYEITRIPSGTYTIMAWNDGAVRDSRFVTVPQPGGPIEVDFVLR